MAKYDALLNLLEEATGEVELTFEQIEQTLGFDLPVSARRYPAWWSNSGGTHVQASAWMDAGYRTADVNVGAGRVRFVPHLGSGFGEMKQAKFEPEAPKTQEKGPSGHHPAYGALKGLITIPADVDLAQPAYEDWKSLYGEAE
ncbi:hypothetical protein VW23_009030 [Devosia insulae DS-56]|uniref:DUF7662 domain-containing protein n=1 Tax=Devosia insulae DS-56 TaxID=1116389 RepID=A0A1E5XWH4_9HYPH|nr:hypothetical protein [Devosia insulae]OEO32946.1 hypothetical protein VW23_009030 [Devosia insulae DS-56]